MVAITTKSIIVGSGKGGVGKSLLVHRVAIETRESGAVVGVVDADVANPTQHDLFDVPRGQETRGVFRSSEGIYICSIAATQGGIEGLVAAPDTCTELVIELMEDSLPPLDVLIVDLPGGASDLHARLTAHLMPSVRALVATPDPVAVAGARALGVMWRRLGTPASHLIVNLAHHTCLACGERRAAPGLEFHEINRRVGTPAMATIGFYDYEALDTAARVLADEVVR